MPMTPFMHQMANVLEAQLRPGLAGFIEKEYKLRGDKAPTALRLKELEENCLNRMRKKLEECYDLKITANDVASHCLLEIRLALYDELDKEFPKKTLVIAES